jgi:DNA repair exonuclease SbcCD nuclease subunit
MRCNVLNGDRVTRLLHTADWQIGRYFGQFEPEGAVPLAEARLQVVQTIGALATERQVAAILVAGDVFDAQGLADKTLRRLFQAIATFSGPWIVIPGNHDAALAEGAWRRAMQLGMIPSNVTAILEPGVVPFPELGFVVLAAPLTQRHTYADVTQWFDDTPTAAGLARIGLAHGAVGDILPSEVDSANPIAPDRAARAGLDYLALGDWHGTYHVNDRTWYSGAPEPDRFKNNDAGNVLIVEVFSGAVPEVTPVRTAKFNWRQVRSDLSMPTDVDVCVADLAAVTGGDVVEIEVTGRTDLQGMKRVREALAQAEATARASRVDMSALRLAPTEADIAQLKADGYVGEVLQQLRAEQETDSEGVSALALRIMAETLLDAVRPAP